MNLLILVFWFFLLIKWANILVDWASSIAKKFWISSLVIWLTIVAFWTSAPELVVNLMSAFSWETQLAISNIIWSNISNIFLILWLTSLVYPISMPKSTIKKEIPFVIFVSALFLAFLNDWILSKIDAIILLFLFVWFLFYTYKISKFLKKNKNNDSIKIMSNTKSFIYIFLWLIWLIIWWKLIVDSAVSIATAFWLPKSFIWVTIVAIWTSLPELATSMVAAFKKNTNMAIWWVVWSNIFNILWILWLTWLIHPLKAYEWINLDLQIQLIWGLLIFLAAFTFQKNFLSRIEWAWLFIIYIIYIWYLGSQVI